MKLPELHRLCKTGMYNGTSFYRKIIETHISWVIFTPQFAFKIKKPLKYSFLDFSTLEKRKYYCERELFLNKRFSDIYLDVLPVRKKLNSLQIANGNGEVIDYAVRMKRLQASRKMDVLLREKKVKPVQINTLAKKISEIHKDSSIIKTPLNRLQSKNTFNDILNVNSWIRKFLGKEYSSIVKRSVSYSNSVLRDYSKILEGRIKEGYQRDVHGDLHSKNIFLYKNPIIFDCIEFSDPLRQSDLLSELAFFCMDLDVRNRNDLSELFMKYYLGFFPVIHNKREEDIFLYYKCYRANVRAKVRVLRAMQESGDEMQYHADEVRSYLNLIHQYIN